MAKCGACGKVSIRKTTMAVVIERGKPRGRRVCEACANGGITIVATKIAPVVQMEKSERRAVREVLEPFIKSMEAKSKAYAVMRTGSVPDDDELDLRAEVWQAAAEMLRSGRA